MWCVIRWCEGADLCAVPKDATHSWPDNDMDETVLESHLLWELSPNFIGPSVFVQAEVGHGVW